MGPGKEKRKDTVYALRAGKKEILGLKGSHLARWRKKNDDA